MYYANAWSVLCRRRSRPAPTGDDYPQASSLTYLPTEISSKIRTKPYFCRRKQR